MLLNKILDYLFLRLGDTVVIDRIFQTKRHGKMGAEPVFRQGMDDGGVIGGAVQQRAHIVVRQGIFHDNVFSCLI